MWLFDVGCNYFFTIFVSYFLGGNYKVKHLQKIMDLVDCPIWKLVKNKEIEIVFCNRLNPFVLGWEAKVMGSFKYFDR